MRRLFNLIIPPPKWRIPAAIIAGAIVGLGAYTLHIAKATSYLSDNPKVCVNCHIMTPQYKTWEYSSHSKVASCNDCHVPQDNIFNTYYFKGMDGLRHSTLFTLRAEPQVIKIHEAGQGVVQNNCIRCHKDQIMDARQSVLVQGYEECRTDRQCWECHREVPHGRVSSLSSVPYGKIYEKENPVPEWLKESIKNEYLGAETQETEKN